MKTIMKSKVKKATRPAPGPPQQGIKIKIWQEYVCTFNQKPSTTELSQKKRLFRKSIIEFLLKKRNGKQFSIRVTWEKDAGNPLIYHVKVFIFRKNGPPGPTTTTPQPPPPSPPAL